MRIKKISALLVMMIFILSLVSLALAEENKTAKIKGTEKIKEVEKEVKEKINTELKNLKEERNEIKEQVKNIRESVKEVRKEVKKDYQEAKKDFEVSKGKLREAEGEAKKCLDVNGDLCKSKQKKFNQWTQEHLSNLVEIILGNLDKVKQKIESSDLSAEQKEDLLEDINAQITALDEVGAGLQNTTIDMTKEELKEAVKTIKDSWKISKSTIKIGLGELMGLKLGNIINKTEILKARFDKDIAKLSEEGYDVTKLAEYQSEMALRLASAKENWETAREKFQEAKTKDEPNKLIAEAQDYLGKARKDITLVRESLRQITKEIKEQKKKILPAKNKGNNAQEKGENELGEVENNTTSSENEAEE